MNARHILFRTNRFNLSSPKGNSINPCCFGEDLAQWLRKKLVEEGFNVRPPGQEDWGWYLRLRYGRDSYLLGIGASGNELPRGNDGEWRIIVKKNRSVRQMATNKGRTQSDDPVVARIERLLREETDFRDVKIEKHDSGSS